MNKENFLFPDVEECVWRPISEEAKTYGYVLLWNGQDMTMGSFDGVWLSSEFTHNGYEAFFPTHWMPLPFPQESNPDLQS